MRERNIEAEIYRHMEVEKWSEDKSVFMDYNPNSRCMKQSRRNIFEQNAHLMRDCSLLKRVIMF
jgi:hypothetical protein